MSVKLVCDAACASPRTPFPFLEALAHLGQPHAALAALQARAGGLGASASPLHQLTLLQVQAAVRLYLECGSVAEAFLEVRLPQACSCPGLMHVRITRYCCKRYHWAVEEFGAQMPCMGR